MLTEQRAQFVKEYIKLKCKNQKQAAINAGYSPKSAQSQASQILNDPKVREYLAELKSKLISDLQQELIFDAVEAVNVLYEIMTDKNASDKDRIAAAKEFLDRAGFKGQTIDANRQQDCTTLYEALEDDNE